MKYPVIKGWKITGAIETSRGISLCAELTTGPPQCRYCQASPEALRPRGTRSRMLMDVPERGKPVEVLVERHRFFCTQCERTSLQPLPGVDGQSGATLRLLELAADRAFHKPVSLVARETGLSERTVRATFYARAERLLQTNRYAAPRVLGIDEVFVKGRPRLLLTDVETRRVIHLDKSDDQAAALRMLSGLRDRGRVEVVVIPMSRPLRSAVRRMLPQAKVIVNRFVVMSLGACALDAVRLRVRGSSRRRYSEVHPQFVAAYALKARFMDVWRSTSSLTARRRYEEWEASVPRELAYAFGPLRRVVKAWSDEIFGSFDDYRSSSHLEAISRVVETSGRQSFQMIRGKLLSRPPFR